MSKLNYSKHATHVGSLLGEGDVPRDLSPKVKCHTPGPIAKKRLPARCSYNQPDLSGGYGHAGKQPDRRLGGHDRSKWGCFGIPISLASRGPIGRGSKALNPGGAGAKPLRPSLLPLRKPASSHNACIIDVLIDSS